MMSWSNLRHYSHISFEKEKQKRFHSGWLFYRQIIERKFSQDKSESLMRTFICDIKNFFMKNNVFEKVLKYIQIRGLLLINKRICSHASLCILIQDTKERGKAYWGRTLVFFTAIAGHRVNVDLKLHISVHAGIFGNPKMKQYLYLYSRIKQYIRGQEAVIAAKTCRYEARRIYLLILLLALYPQTSPLDICP